MTTIKKNQRMKHLVYLFALLIIVGWHAPTASAQKMNLDLYTSVDRLFDLEKGMSMETVISTLQCEPHALIQHTQGGYLMLEWRYLHKDRWISAEQSKQDGYRTQGDDFWVEPASAYLMFNNAHEFINFVTEEGLAKIRDAYAWQATSQAVGLERSECRACEVTLPASFAPEVPEPETAPEEPARGLGGLLGGGESTEAAGEGGSESAPATGLGTLGRLTGIGNGLAPRSTDN
jgi:hypothetical protein